MTQEGRNQKRKIPGSGLNIQSYILTSPDLKEKKRNFERLKIFIRSVDPRCFTGGWGGGGVEGDGMAEREEEPIPISSRNVFPITHLWRAIQNVPSAHHSNVSIYASSARHTNVPSAHHSNVSIYASSARHTKCSRLCIFCAPYKYAVTKASVFASVCVSAF